ncbi:MAG: hypothetical protein ACKOFF_04385 [Acidimicrobiales bacterium]
MGLLDGLTRRRAARRHARALETHNAGMVEWSEANDRLTSWIETVQACVDGKIDEQFVDRSDYGFMFDSDEFAVACISGPGTKVPRWEPTCPRTRPKTGNDTPPYPPRSEPGVLTT